jgi:hypothetical protein
MRGLGALIGLILGVLVDTKIVRLGAQPAASGRRPSGSSNTSSRTRSKHE